MFSPAFALLVLNGPTGSQPVAVTLRHNLSASQAIVNRVDQGCREESAAALTKMPRV